MQLCLGCKSGAAPANIREMAMKQFAISGKQIAGADKDPKEYHAGFLHEWNDLDEVYAENLPKLKEVKKKYDPKNRFNKGVDLTGGKITPNATV
jgi:FAD/FMN-containing dehydrogenase